MKVQKFAFSVYYHIKLHSEDNARTYWKKNISIQTGKTVVLKIQQKLIKLACFLFPCQQQTQPPAAVQSHSTTEPSQPPWTSWPQG